MRSTPPRARLTALSLLTLLGVLSTGLPSHHHEDAQGGDVETRMISADHHGHVSALVEQDERAPTGSLEIPVPAVLALGIGLDSGPDRPVFRRDVPPSPLERAPPPSAPRAPPHLA